MERQEYTFGERQTTDKEWYEGELKSIVMSICHQTCKQIKEDMGRGQNVVWYNESLLYEDTLCHEVCSNYDIIKEYNACADGIGQFEQIMHGYISQIVDKNRYTGYIKDNTK